MPQLLGTTTSLPLTQVSLAYKNPQGSYIHDQIAPAIIVVKDTADIYSYGAENLRVVSTIRARGGKSNEIDWSVTKASAYKVADHALSSYIPHEDYDNAEKPLDVQVDTTEMITDMLIVAKEYALAQSLQSTSVMTNNVTLTGSDQWSDYTNSDPIDDILTGIQAVKAATAKIPNTLIIAWDAYLKLLYHPKIKDMFPAATSITFDMLSQGLSAKFPMIKKVLVGMASYNNSNLGAAMNLDDIWTKTCIVAYIEQTPTLKSRSLAFTYQKKAPRTVDFIAAGGSNDKDLISRKSDFIQVSDAYDQVLVDVNCGYLVKNCIA